MSLFFLALLAGFITVLSPCILPVLPIILGSSLKGHKSYPVFMVLGMALSFSLLGVLFGAFGNQAGIDRLLINQIVIGLLFLMGVILMSKTLSDFFSQFITRASSPLHKRIPNAQNLHQPLEAILLGMMLGILWAPCAGPILGSIILLATKGGMIYAGFMLFVYAIGAGIPMLLIAYGGASVLKKLRIFQSYSEKLKVLFGFLLVLMAFLLWTGLLRQIEVSLVSVLPPWMIRLSTLF